MKIKKKLCLFLSAIFIFSVFGLFGCAEDGGYAELVGDPDFKAGLTIESTGTGNDPVGRKVIDYGGSAEGDIYWRFAQHNCNKSLRNGKEIKDGDWYEYTDSQEDDEVSKRLRINPVTGEFQLNCDTSKDYESPRDDSRDPWVHMLVEQGFYDETLVSDFQEMTLNISYTLLKCQNLTGDAYNPMLHAAQIQLCFVLQNINSAEAFWFVIPLYDNRADEFFSAKGNFDLASNMFIAKADPNQYCPNGLPQPGERIEVSIDLLKALGDALEYANSLGYMMQSSMDDLYFVNFNLGWEIPGVFDVGMLFHDFSLKAKYKDAIK